MDNNFSDFDMVDFGLDVDSTPSLSLDTNELMSTSKEQAQIKQEATNDLSFQMENLSPQEQKMVNDFSKTIDLTNSAQVLQYGAGSQKKIADFSETALKNVRSKDMGEVGGLLTNMVNELQTFENDEEKGGFFGFFKKQKNKIDSLKTKYATAEVNINKIVESLDNYQYTLMKDIAMLDKMYEVNKDYFKELSMYILAGKKKIEEAKNNELPKLIRKSQETGLPEDTQAANDYAQMIDRFEKKIHDLELTRVVAIQMAPQIRLVQNNDTLMAEKIQSSLVNTIPLWKSQMALSLGIAHSAEALEAQRAVTNMTNELLRKNSQMLKQESVNIAKEAERGIVDIETLKQTNNDLISTFDEVLQIQKEGREKRIEAEKEIAQIENELKLKMLELSRKQLQ